MFRKNLPPEPDAALERRVRDFVSPLAGAEPANSAARSALRRALQHAGPPRSHSLRAWQRAAVGLAGVFVPLFAVGSVAGLGGSGAVTAPLDAVAGVFKAGEPSGGGGGDVDLAVEEAESPEAAVCADANAEARVELQALLDGGALSGSAAAGVTAALAVLDDCGSGGAICFEATATAREILQALLDTETLTADGRAGIEMAIAAIDACGSGDDEAEGGTETTEDQTPAAEDLGGGNGTGHETCFEATTHAREVLQSLLDDEDRPEQSKKGLERALEALEKCGTGSGNGGEDPAGATRAPAVEPASTPTTQPAAAETISVGSSNTVTIGKPENPGNSGDHKPSNPDPAASQSQSAGAGVGVGVGVGGGMPGGSEAGASGSAGGGVDPSTLPGGAHIHTGGNAGAGGDISLDSSFPEPAAGGVHLGGSANAGGRAWGHLHVGP